MRSHADWFSKSKMVSFCGALLLIAIPLASTAESPTLKALYDQHRWFELRDAIQGKAAPLLYQGAVAAAFNRNIEAERYLAEVIKDHPSSDDAGEAREILAKLYARSGKYKEALNQLGELQRSKPTRADVANVRLLFAAWSKYPNQFIPEAPPATVHAVVHKEEIRLPVLIHGKTVHWLLDTGFNFCLVSESEAKMLGIPVDETSSKISDIAGGTTAMRTAVVDDLAIGHFHIQNVAFLVMPDAQEPMTDWQQTGRGILGLPIALAFRSFSWKSDGTFLIHPVTRAKQASQNLSLDGFTLIARVDFENKPLEFSFDTGDGSGSQLWQRFADDFPTLLAEQGRKGKQKVEEVGGANEHSITRLPELTLKVGGLKTILRRAQVFSKPVGDEFHHGLLGMDVLNQAREVRVDFDSMKLEMVK